jgi:hypothetical protein
VTFQRFARQVPIRIRDSGHSDRSHWNQVVSATRFALREADAATVSQIVALLDLKRPLNDLFRDVYTLTAPPVRPARLRGSCPFTRRRHCVDFMAAVPEVIPVTTTHAALAQAFERALAPCSDGVGRFWITYHLESGDARSARRWQGSLMSLLRLAVSNGVVELCLIGHSIPDTEWSQLVSWSTGRFIIRTLASNDYVAPSAVSPVPRLTLLDNAAIRQGLLPDVAATPRPIHIIVSPDDTPDPDWPQRRFFDVVPHLPLDELLSRLGQ